MRHRSAIERSHTGRAAVGQLRGTGIAERIAFDAPTQPIEPSVMAECEGIRRALLVAGTAALLVACGRTDVLLELWRDDTGDTAMLPGPVAGSAGAPTLLGPGAAGATQSTIAGQGGMSGADTALGQAGSAGIVLAGAAGGPQGGGAGEAGAAGMGGESGARALKPCARAVMPLLDGLLATPMEQQPIRSIAGDWNGDGKQDLAIGNIDASVSVLLGKGDGLFAASVTYQSGLEPAPSLPPRLSLEASDLDGNGSLDLVIAPSLSSGISVLLGTGDGSFAAPVIYELAGQVAEFCLGDFDGDGHPDIAVASDQGAALLRNHGDGSFGTGVPVTAKHDPLNSITVGDLNHDGRLDLAALGDYAAMVLIGNGDGSFVPAQAPEGGMYDDPVRIADINGDGHADLLYPQSCGPATWGAWTRVFLGRGDGTFADELSNFTKRGCNGHAVADLNGDGATDVLIASPFTVQFGAANGLLPAVKSLKASGGNLLGTGDWNGDGKLDLALAAEQWFTVQLGNGDGTFGSDPVYQPAFDAVSLDLADLDADGVLDVAVMSEAFGERGSTETSLSVFRGTTSGTLGARVDYPSSLNSSVNTVLVDLDSDGDHDLVTSLSDSIIVRLGTGTGSFASEATLPVGTYVAAYAVGDLNQDGHPDIAVGISNPPEVRWLPGVGDGTFGPFRTVQVPSGPAGLAIVDIDGDQRQDLAVTFGIDSTMGVFLGQADGTFSTGLLFSTKATSGITSADLNADGHADLVTWGDAWDTDSFSVFLGSGKGGFLPRLDYRGRATGVAAVDFNRDGHQDLIKSDWSGIAILLGAGDGTFICEARYVGDSMRDLGVGDLNRDGRLDIATTSEAGVNVFLNASP